MTFDTSAPLALFGGPAIRPGGPPEWPLYDPAIAAVLADMARTGDWGRYHGEFVPRLVERLRTLHDAEHVILTSSGTAAIELALRGLNLNAGEGVILAGYDFKGNFVDTLVVGGVPVLVDVDPMTAQLDVERIGEVCRAPDEGAPGGKSSIGNALRGVPGRSHDAERHGGRSLPGRTRAVIASHLHGGVVPMQRLREIADAHGLSIIEDACQMPGAILDGVRAGMAGDVGVISFGGSKLLTAGRGGAILTNRSDIAARIRRYTERGNEAYPLSELQAAVILPQLDRLDAGRAERQQRVAEIVAGIASFSGLTPIVQSRIENPESKIPASADGPDFYKVAFRYDAAAFGGVSRLLFCAALRAEGIAVARGFRALHRIHASSRFRAVGELPEADRADKTLIVLHHPVLLEGPRGVEEILAALRKVQQNVPALRARGEHLASAAEDSSDS